MVKSNDKEHAIVTPTDKERHGSLVPVSRDTEHMGIGTRVCDQIPIQPQDVHLRRRSVLCESVRKTQMVLSIWAEERRDGLRVTETEGERDRN